MIPIRALQHYYYCPHRWGMLYLEDGWQDNAFTVISGIMHERVHSGQRTAAKNTEILRGVSVYSKKLGVYGKTDCLEVTYFAGAENRYKSIKLIEYKPTAPKGGHIGCGDRLQIYAQYLCVQELFGCDTLPYIFYGDTRKRVPVIFDESDDKTLKDVISKINISMDAGSVPPAVYSPKCRGCSVYDSCLPRVGYVNVDKIIAGELE